MLLDEFEDYCAQYEKEAKKISFRSSRLKIIKDNPHLKIEPSHSNFDLYFNREGLLLHSVHFERNIKVKIIYGYDKRKRIISIMKLSCVKNELIEISEFTYNVKGRIEIENIRSFYNNPDWNEVTKHIHTYLDNQEKIFITSDNDDEDEYTFCMTYDNNKMVVEGKAIRNEDELIWWGKNEYNETGVLVKEISIDENGEQEIIYELIPKEKTTDNIADSKNLHNQGENIYKYNKNGHWINKVWVDDGVPKEIYDRTIEYYKNER